MQRYVPIHDCVMMVMNGHVIINMIKEQGLDGALSSIREIRDRILESSKQRMILLLTEMQGIIAEQKRKRRVGESQQIHEQESIQSFTRDFLTELYIRLRLQWLVLRLTDSDCAIDCIPCECNAAVVGWVMKILCAIREGPYQYDFWDVSYIDSH